MNKQDEDKAKEIAKEYGINFPESHSSAYPLCYKAALDMAAWKEQQMIEKAVYKCAAMLHKIDDLLRAKGLKGQFEDEFDKEYKKFKKAMEEN